MTGATAGAPADVALPRARPVVPMHVIETEGLSLSFRSLMAVQDVSFKVRGGQVHAVIGPNGAGKSTLLNLLAGTLRPGAGRISFEGRDITHLSVHRRARMGITRSYQIVNLFPELTCEQVARLAVQRDMSMRDWFSAQGGGPVEARARALLADAGLANLAGEDTVRLSHGLQKHLEIALALANDAQLLLLDEPMAGMSANERGDLGKRIRALAGSRTVVFVEHDIDMVMSLADTVTVMHNGRIVAEGTPSEVRADATTQSVYLRGTA